MPKFINITDIDGDVHLVNTEQLCSCNIEKIVSELYLCTLTFCDNSSSFYLEEEDAISVFNLLGATT